MNKSTIGALAVAGVLLVGGVGSYFSAASKGNQMEQAIKYTYDNNQQILSQYSQKVAEVAQVPAMMRDDVAQVTKAAIEGRYGQDGSKAVFQMIKEQNPQLSEKLYINIQNTIVDGRSRFEAAQTRLNDQKQVYETALGAPYGGFWMRLAGYPRINLAEFKTVKTQKVVDTFDRGVENEPIKLR